MLDVGAGPVPHQGLEDGLPRQAGGFGREEIGNRPSQHVIALVSQGGEPEVADRDDATFQVDRVCHHRRAVVERAVAAFALRQRLERELLVGDVPGHPDDGVVRHG